jgi:membrane-associated phospholipid phosphatase
MILASSVKQTDRRLMRRAQRIRSPRLDRSLVTLTTAANHSVLWFLIAAALNRFGGRRGRAAGRSGVLAIMLASSVTNGPVKLAFRRRRPSSRRFAPLIRVPRSTSFPSGHSSAAFAFATAASVEMPALAPALMPLAGAIAYSRVHTGVHYPTDVVAGAALGVAAGAISTRRPHDEGLRPES